MACLRLTGPDFSAMHFGMSVYAAEQGQAAAKVDAAPALDIPQFGVLRPFCVEAGSHSGAARRSGVNARTPRSLLLAAEFVVMARGGF